MGTGSGYLATVIGCAKIHPEVIEISKTNLRNFPAVKLLEIDLIQSSGVDDKFDPILGSPGFPALKDALSFVEVYLNIDGVAVYSALEDSRLRLFHIRNPGDRTLEGLIEVACKVMQKVQVSQDTPAKK